jgi:hypothetical protein
VGAAAVRKAGYWVSGSPPLEQDLHEICALTGPRGSTTAIVEDAGGFGELGATLCGVLAHEGWTADPNAPAEGPQEQAYNEARSEEEASERRHERAVEACEREAEAAQQREAGSDESGMEAGEREYEIVEKCQRGGG